MKFLRGMHRIKDFLLFPRSKNNINIVVRSSLATLILIEFFTILGCYVWNGFFSLAFFFVCLALTLFACTYPIFHKGWVRNIVFLVIFSIGIWCYSQMSAETGNATFRSKNEASIILFPAIYHSHTALAAFFPSRGPYEVTADGKDVNDEDVRYSEKFIISYLVFHAAVYMFAGYFIMLLWGYRTVNRLRFYLTRDAEKHVFWCITPEPKMLKLAADILKNSKESAQPVFSVEETAYDDQRALFQEMTFQKFCLKFRKPGQIHKNCLFAVRHFFLSEDSDWNIGMADALLAKISNLKVKAQLYIRITNDARKMYYIRWADRYKNTDIEIIFIDECALIVDKFTKSHHILDAFSKCIDENAAVCKEGGFKFLIIGFGGLGQEVLKHLACDTCFLDAKDNPVPIKIDIIEKDAERIALFQKQYAEFFTGFCKDFSVEFNPENEKVIAAGTAEFYSFFEKHHKKYDRIIVALGDAALNIETIAQIEDIIRKNIDLSSSDPEAELKKWKDKLFLISPEICGKVLRTEEDKNNDKDNIFTVIGANHEIFNYSDIINEEMFNLAKKVNYRYSTNSTDEFTQEKSDLEWSKAGFYGRQSSYAAALGLDNTIFLLKKNTDAKKYISDNGCFDEKFSERFKSEENRVLREKLGTMEHRRWLAYMLGCGYSTWQKPQQRFGDLEKANQTKKFLRHATMIEWQSLPEMDAVFRNIINFSLNGKNILCDNASDRGTTFKLDLKARVCDSDTIDLKALPITGEITLSVSKSVADKEKATTEEKLKAQLEQFCSLINGASLTKEIPQEEAAQRGNRVSDRLALILRKDGKAYMSDICEEKSGNFFSKFSILCNQIDKDSLRLAIEGYTPAPQNEDIVVGCKVKECCIEIEDISEQSIFPMVQTKDKDLDVDNFSIEAKMCFTGVLHSSGKFEYCQNFKQNDFDLIENLPFFFKQDEAVKQKA